MVAREQPSDAAVRTASGLFVPPSAIVADGGKPVADAVRIALKQRATAYDPDGRRRIGLTKDEERAIDKAVRVLNQHGIGLILGCVERYDGKDPCKGFLTPEGRDRDSGGGFGCACSRVHFLGV
jgi:hypothetical protein